MPFDGAEFEVDAVGQVLLRAAALVERGWCQGSYRAHTGVTLRYCAVGAVDKARVLCGMDSGKNNEIFSRVCRLQLDVVGFNDAPGRTQAEVVALLRRAAYER